MGPSHCGFLFSGDLLGGRLCQRFNVARMVQMTQRYPVSQTTEWLLDRAPVRPSVEWLALIGEVYEIRSGLIFSARVKFDKALRPPIGEPGMVVDYPDAIYRLTRADLDRAKAALAGMKRRRLLMTCFGSNRHD